MTKKTYNIWKYNRTLRSPTGPWSLMGAVKAADEHEALQIAKSCYGTNEVFGIYEGLVDQPLNMSTTSHEQDTLLERAKNIAVCPELLEKERKNK